MRSHSFQVPANQEWQCRALAGVAVAALALGGATATATTVVRVGLPQLAESASLIVEGRVESATTVRSQAPPGVFAEYRVQVTRTYKGTTNTEVLVRVPGGRTDRGQVSVPGMPVLNARSRVLLFLEPLPRSAWSREEPTWLPIGLDQGHFVLDEEAGMFRRHTGRAAMLDGAFCTGGEFVDTVQIGVLRHWLGYRLGDGK